MEIYYSAHQASKLGNKSGCIFCTKNLLDPEGQTNPNLDPARPTPSDSKY